MVVNRCFLFALLLIGVIAGVLSKTHAAETARIEQWGVFEVALQGPAAGNPFVDVQLTGRFVRDGDAVEVQGFYDGGGTFRLRFMPANQGEWRYTTRSNKPELNGKSGSFVVGPPSADNHGPLQVQRTFHFAYADGTPFFPVGTTSYAWVHQPLALQEQTLETLSKSPFNKLRMCVFPKSYAYNRNEPTQFPVPRGEDGKLDFTRFDVAFWQLLERRIGELLKLGVQADLILFHPYDRWGFAEMDDASDDRYVRYAIARLAAYRNVWWSLANEYELLATPEKQPGHRGNKFMEDWDRIFQLLQKEDPHSRLRSIHNWQKFYDHSKPWVSHCSVQSHSVAEVSNWRAKYQKPVVVDECGYEGNITHGWGNLSAQEMVRRFWIGTMSGGYVGHGETYTNKEEILWWSKGGVLHGESPARIAFLKKTMEALPYTEMQPSRGNGNSFVLAREGVSYLVYATEAVPMTIKLNGAPNFAVDVIDTWAMTVASMGTAPAGEFSFTPPRANCVIRFTAQGRPPG